MATHSSNLAWRIPWTEDAWQGDSPLGRKELGTKRLSTHSLMKLLTVALGNTVLDSMLVWV